jgi:hypothetical protein
MALRGVPLERRWSERTPGVQRSGPDAGCVSSWLLLLAALQEEVTRRARRNQKPNKEEGAAVWLKVNAG